MKDRIYLDNAATTAVDPEVLETMLPYFTEVFGNPSSIHGTGREAGKAIDIARKQVAAAIGAQPQEIYFTAGGSESDNWVLKGTAFARKGKGNHIITTATPRLAPSLTPSIDGPARGFLKSVWSKRPLTANDEPAKTAVKDCGRRDSIMI